MEKSHTKNIHVIKRDGQWVVRGESTRIIKSVHPTQLDAIIAARKIAQNEKSELVIHGLDGRIRERDRYFAEPLPPKLPRKVLYPTSVNKSNGQRIKKAITEVIGERKESAN